MCVICVVYYAEILQMSFEKSPYKQLLKKLSLMKWKGLPMDE